jgi:hypothetical protein
LQSIIIPSIATTSGTTTTTKFHHNPISIDIVGIIIDLHHDTSIGGAIISII